MIGGHGETFNIKPGAISGLRIFAGSGRCGESQAIVVRLVPIEEVCLQVSIILPVELQTGGGAGAYYLGGEELYLFTFAP